MENANQVKLSTSSIKSYGRIFKINYEDVFNKNNKTSQDKLTMKVTINDKNVILNKKDLDVYHLECLEILSLENICAVYLEYLIMKTRLP